MDKSSQILLKQEKERWYTTFINTLIAALEKGEITTDDAADIADYILTSFDPIQTQGELMQFLNHLSRRWDMFAPYYTDSKRDELIGQIEHELVQLAQPTA